MNRDRRDDVLTGTVLGICFLVWLWVMVPELDAVLK